MTGPAIFQPGDPEISRNPIFNPNQNQATGMANIPGRFSGAADALSQLVQLQQSKKDEALGKLARIHAAIDAGVYPQSVMDTPEVQALFPAAGLDALQHQTLLPKPSDQITQQKSAELASPIFAGPDAVGGAGSRAVTGLPQQAPINVQNQQAQDTGTPEVARQVGGQPSPETAVIKDQTAPIEATNAKTEAVIGGKKLTLVDTAVEDGEKRYKTDPQFRSFIQDVHAGVIQPYVEALKQSIASLGLEKQAQGNAASILGSAITKAPEQFATMHKDWLDQQSKERASFAQSLQLSTKSEDEQANDVADHMMKWNFDHHEPTLEGTMSGLFDAAAHSLGMTPQQSSDVLKSTIKIETPKQQRLQTGPNRVAVIGSIIEQAKHDPQHITFDPGDGKGAITVTLSQLYGSPKTPLKKTEIDYIKQTLAGKNPKFNPAAGAGQGGGSHRPVNPVGGPSQVP